MPVEIAHTVTEALRIIAVLPWVLAIIVAALIVAGRLAR